MKMTRKDRWYKKIRRIGEGAHGYVNLCTVNEKPPLPFTTLGRYSYLSLPIRGIKMEEEIKPQLELDEESHRQEVRNIFSTIDLEDYWEDETINPLYNSHEYTCTFPYYTNSENFIPPKNTQVAVKKMYLQDSTIGFSMESVRELKLLQEIHHPNIVSVYHVYIRNDNLCMVMECLPNDLEKFINNANIILTQSHIKCIMLMILRGVAKLHEMYIMHRDLKPSNILMADDGTLRIADFGGAKFAGSPDRKFSPQACTLWYRAPELLFGSKYYGPQSDMWSVGCIFGELLLRTPLFMGENTDITQLEKIFSILGPSTEQDWPGVSSLPGYIAFSAPVPFRPLEADLHASPKSAVNLLMRILQKNPKKRISASEALQDPYFTESPVPCAPSDLPKYYNS